MKTTKIIKLMIIPALLLLAGAIYFSCDLMSNPISGGSNTGTLVVKLPGAAKVNSSMQRASIKSNYGFLDRLVYRIECSGPGQVSKDFSADEDVRLTLTTGNWNIKIIVLNNADLSDPIGSKTEQVTIETGKIATIGADIAIDPDRCDIKSFVLAFGSAKSVKCEFDPVNPVITAWFPYGTTLPVAGNSVSYTLTHTGDYVDPAPGTSIDFRNISAEGGTGVPGITVFALDVRPDGPKKKVYTVKVDNLPPPNLGDGIVFNVGTAEAWNDALFKIDNDYSLTDDVFTINVTGSFTASVNTGYTFGMRPLSVTITGSGSNEVILDSDSTGNLLLIHSGQDVVLNNLRLVGHMDNDDSLVYISGGTLTMMGNASIAYNTNNGGGAGGGVCIADGGILNLTENASIHSNKGDNGGGVYITGDNGSRFNMTGGEIYNNEAIRRGGGVYRAAGDGKFKKTGGEIGRELDNDNKANEYYTDFARGHQVFILEENLPTTPRCKARNVYVPDNIYLDSDIIENWDFAN